MDTIDETQESDIEIDLEFTDAESESYCSETLSDRAFIVPDENPSLDDPSYEPSESGGSESSDASSTQVRPLGLVQRRTETQTV
jgi:hypothetical protein